MHLLKPFSLTVLHAAFDWRGKTRLVVVVGAMVPFAGDALESEQNLWKLLPTLPGSTGSLDEIKPKTRGEVLLLGSAHAPGGVAAPVVAVKLAVGEGKLGEGRGAIKKEVWAIGDRVWRADGPSDPVPFRAMPLEWARAFGGEEYPANPLGRGVAAVAGPGGTSHPLPNLEAPGKLVVAPGDRPEPVGFGMIDPSWPQRARRAGTYDKRWLDTRYPEPPDDFDPAFYNLAPADQWIEGHFAGTEPFVLENVHPAQPRIEGRLPGFVARVIATRTEGEASEDVAMRCDTVIFVPEHEKVILLWRGTLEVADEDASDVADLTVGLERIGVRRPVEHYARVRAARRDKRTGAVASLRDRDLVPEGVRPAKLSDGGDMAELMEHEGLAARNARASAQASLDRSRQQMVDAGLDPDPALPRTIPPEEPIDTSPDGLADLMTKMESEAEQQQRRALEEKEQAIAELRARCAEQGLDADEILRQRERSAGGPPKFTVASELARLEDMAALARTTGVPMPRVERLEDPAFIEELRETERLLRDAYRRFAHFLTPALALEPAESARVRDEVSQLHAAGVPLGERDLTGADLRGLDLRGADLSGAFLEAADLRGVDLRGAKLDGAVPTRALLEDANLEGATATGANLGQARLTRAVLRGAELSEAVLHGAVCEGTDLDGAVLDRADLSEATFAGATLRRVRARDLVALRVSFERADLGEADLEKASFLEARMPGARLDGASLEGALLLDVDAAGATFVGARARNLRVVRAERGSTLGDTDFTRADLRMANLRGVSLPRARFDDAWLDGADLSGADLTDASLGGARAVEARFIKSDLTGADLSRADLMNALLTRAVVRGAVFVEASVFQADLAKAVGDERTTFRGANVNRARRAAEKRGG